MLPCEQLFPGVGAVAGQVEAEQRPAYHLAMPAARRWHADVVTALRLLHDA